jgi:hypothetical protein
MSARCIGKLCTYVVEKKKENSNKEEKQERSTQGKREARGRTAPDDGQQNVLKEESSKLTLAHPPRRARPYLQPGS